MVFTPTSFVCWAESPIYILKTRIVTDKKDSEESFKLNGASNGLNFELYCLELMHLCLYDEDTIEQVKYFLGWIVTKFVGWASVFQHNVLTKKEYSCPPICFYLVGNYKQLVNNYIYICNLPTLPADNLWNRVN